MASAQECVLQPRKFERDHGQKDQERRGRAAQSRVQQGQVSRARHVLIGAPLAPKNDETLRALQDRRPREQVRPILREVMEFEPTQPLRLDMHTFIECLRSAPAWERSCPWERRSDSTLSRPVLGTERANVSQIWKSSVPRCGPQGMKILGTPVVTEALEESACAERLEEEDKLWNAIHWIPDLQCAWQVLVQCARPRCHRKIRTMPPPRSATYAHGHDWGMQRPCSPSW